MKKYNGLLAAVCIAVSSVMAADRPNVVFILIDDLSHYGVTAYGVNKIGSVDGYFDDVEYSTPRMDSLAEDGLRCDYAYAYPLCEPTRIALMSGMNNVRNYHQPKAQHASDITFGDVFQRAGYETCIVGKWKQTRGTKKIRANEYIFEFGWDEFCCFDVFTEGLRMLDPVIVENGKPLDTNGIDPETGRRYFGPDIFNRYALDFIDRNSDKPFFLYYSMVLVHDEHTPTPDTRPKSVFDEHDVTKPTEYGSSMLGDDRRFMPDMIAYTDKMIGKVLDKLKAEGIADNTLVVVMGDNGTKEAFYHILPDGTKFYGDKGSNKEGGLHVPLLLRAPQRIPAKSTYAGLVNVTDIYPTLLDAAGIDIPNPDNIDGISFWPQATGKSDVEHRDVIYTWYNANNSTTNLQYQYEYAFNKKFKRYAPNSMYPEGRFFDLRTDLFETAGDQKKKVPNVWNKWHHSGLDIHSLTPEQKEGYDALGTVLEKKKYRPVEKLQIVKGEEPLRPGQSKQLECRVYPENASRRSVIWESDNPEVATVDKFGTVQAHRKGEAKITVYSWDDAYPVANPKKDEYKTDGLQSSVTIGVVK